MNNGNNFLICVGFIGKLATNSSIKFNLKIDDVVSLMENKGIKLLKPLKLNSEKYAGLEWNLERFTQKEILKPTDHLMCINSKGKASVRFTDYQYTNKKETDE